MNIVCRKTIVFSVGLTSFSLGQKKGKNENFLSICWWLSKPLGKGRMVHSTPHPHPTVLTMRQQAQHIRKQPSFSETRRKIHEGHNNWTSTSYIPPASQPNTGQAVCQQQTALIHWGPVVTDHASMAGELLPDTEREVDFQRLMQGKK